MQNHNISPALATRLKNNALQTTTNIAQSTSTKNNNQGDSFVKRNKNAIVATSLIGSLAVIATTIFAYSRGKAINDFNKNESKLFSNIIEGFKSFFGKNKENYDLNIKKKNVSVELEKPQNNNKPVDNKPVEIKPQQEIDIKTAKIIRNPIGANSYAPTPASLDKTSVENDLKLWAQKAQEAPEFTTDNRRLNNIDIESLQNLTPHSYQDTCDIYMRTRRSNHGFPSQIQGISDGEFGLLESGEGLPARVNRFKVDKIFDESDPDLCKIGKTDKGKAFVYAKIYTGDQNASGRHGTSYILLESDTAEFTQEQLDLIKIIKNAPNDRTPSVLRSAFIQEKDVSNNACCPLYFNKNAFLSLLQSEAAKYAD